MLLQKLGRKCTLRLVCGSDLWLLYDSARTWLNVMSDWVRSGHICDPVANIASPYTLVNKI